MIAWKIAMETEIQHMEYMEYIYILNDSKNKACKSKTTRENAFKILDDARTDYELALKEGLDIKWFKPALNKQKAHEVITLSV